MGYTFDGPSKLIVLTPGTTSVAVRDMWSRWVDWFCTGDNSRFLPAMYNIGGDDLGGGRSLGISYFLENGWKVRPQEANHVLAVSGNLYSRDGLSPFVSTLGIFNVSVQMTVSNLVDQVAAGGGSGGLTLAQASQLAQAAAEAKLARQLAGNRAEGLRVGVETLVTVYDDDGVTPLRVLRISEDGSSRTVS